MPDAWIVEHADGSQELLHTDPTPEEVEADGETEIVDRYPDAVRRGAVPEPFDVHRFRWDFDLNAAVLRMTPAEARDERWADAKRYRDEDRYFRTLPVDDVVVGQTIMVQCDAKSRENVSDLAQAATWASMRGEELEITFTDADNVPFTVNAEQTIAIKAAVTLNDALCHVASQAIRVELDAALAAGATADAILSIDVTAGYPA